MDLREYPSNLRPCILQGITETRNENVIARQLIDVYSRIGNAYEYQPMMMGTLRGPQRRRIKNTWVDPIFEKIKGMGIINIDLMKTAGYYDYTMQQFDALMNRS